ncbi:MAG TPA: OmcA/MtrC family decaheme c-type cytochrome [Bryobacteraceae bacterium]|nr:OmcA/MtrC family decaheme c-type cytochrome [Bryobacteraceae bacterium]
MKRSALTRAVVALVCTLALITTAAAERPGKKNKAFNTAASAFPFVTTGVAVKIQSASIASDGTITTRFTLTDSKGKGLDITGVQSPGTLSLAFVAAYIPNGKSQYVAYTVKSDASTTNDNSPQIQASTDSGGTYTLVDALSGTYDYTFKTKAANFDATATHSIGMQAERDLSDFGFADMFTSDDVFSFVPNGSPVTSVRDVINEASCNKCHNPLNAHGQPGPRQKVAFCVMCHTPQSVNPDTLNTVDLKVFIHKLHMGSSLASVQAGGKYYVVHRGTVEDYSTVVFPQDTRNCTTCHAAGPTQANNWKTKPSRDACGSCHETVNFATGENHVNLPQKDDSLCSTCHSSVPTGEFDISIPGAHVVPNNSAALPGIVAQVLKVDNATPGNAPTITFQVTDKSGNPVNISTLTQIRAVLAGPNTDYGTGPGGIRVAEDVSKAPGSNGVYTYTMTNKIPAGGTGSYTVSLEARNNVTLMAGTQKQQTASDNAKPVEFYFAVDNSQMTPRRQVVSTDKCSNCHQDLTFVHSGVRGNTQECTMCHNPTLSDGTSGQSVSFATQIHSIHRGENLTNPYVLGTTNYQEVRFPGDLRDCSTCHLDGTYRPENVGAKAMIASPGGFLQQTGPIAAACQGCHDDKSTASHALANTTTLGESCATCHGQNGDFSVDVVHARQ